MKRMLLTVLLVSSLVVLIFDQASAQNRLPPRPPIFLNNNASLYTFPNPNFGKPSQLPFAFVAVAHEDCRLFHNGAKLMPKHRLLAAECIQANNQNPVIPIDPIDPFPLPPFPLPPIDPFPPIFQGINYRRPLYPPPAYATPYGYSGNYASYNPGVPQTNTLTTGYGYMGTNAASRSYQGFGSFRESSYGGFTAAMAESSTQFGNGFGRPSPADKNLEDVEE